MKATGRRPPRTKNLITPTPGPAAKPASAAVQDVYYLESLEQLEALADPLRYRAITLLTRPSTCAQLARQLGISRAKVHYHLKLLERVGLVRYHGEGMSHGIMEKYYIVIGRMLDFTRLMPKKDDLRPNDVTLATYRAIATFLATMLDVSRESILRSSDTMPSGLGLWFDFESALTPKQFGHVRERLRQLERDIISMSKEPGSTARNGELVRFHTTIYLSPLSAPPATAPRKIPAPAPGQGRRRHPPGRVKRPRISNRQSAKGTDR